MNPGYIFSNWSVTAGTASVDTPNSASANATLSSPATLTANFTDGPTSLSAKILSSAGPSNATVFNLEIDNSGPGAANAAQINTLTLAQLAGATCTPVVSTPASFPSVVGNIAPSGSTTTTATVDFSSCDASNAEFNFAMTMSANAGTATGSYSSNISLSGTVELTVTKTHTGNFTEGDPADTYTLTVTNSGGQPTIANTDAVTLTDNLPAGLTATAFGGTGLLGPAAVGTGTLSNSQCTLNTGSAVVPSGNTLQLMLPLTFQPGFTGNKNIFGVATDREGLSSTVRLLGTWTPAP